MLRVQLEVGEGVQGWSGCEQCNRDDVIRIWGGWRGSRWALKIVKLQASRSRGLIEVAAAGALMRARRTLEKRAPHKFDVLSWLQPNFDASFGL